MRTVWPWVRSLLIVQDKAPALAICHPPSQQGWPVRFWGSSPMRSAGSKDSGPQRVCWPGPDCSAVGCIGTGTLLRDRSPHSGARGTDNYLGLLGTRVGESSPTFAMGVGMVVQLPSPRTWMDLGPEHKGTSGIQNTGSHTDWSHLSGPQITKVSCPGHGWW